MGTEQRRLSSSRRNALKNIIRLIPAVVILATMLSAVSCNNNNGLLPQSGGGGSNSPTATPTAGTGALAFVTNFNDGMVSSFTIDGSGALTPIQAATNGKVGVVDQRGAFVYTAKHTAESNKSMAAARRIGDNSNRIVARF